MWFEGHCALCRERHFNILFSMYYTHILYLELIFSCFHWLYFRFLHNFCLYLLLDQVTIDLVHYHIVHIHVFWSIILCNQSGHHAEEDWVKFKHAFKNACCIKNIAHNNLTKNRIFSCSNLSALGCFSNFHGSKNKNECIFKTASYFTHLTMWLGGCRILYLENTSNILSSMYWIQHIIFKIFFFYHFPRLGFRLFHNFCLYLL
jgi:hypothetical protein